jgi:hypothetical protein
MLVAGGDAGRDYRAATVFLALGIIALMSAGRGRLPAGRGEQKRVWAAG